MIFGKIMRDAIAITRGTVAAVLLLAASSIAELAFGAANVVTRVTMSYGALLRLNLRSSSDKDAEITTKEATEIHTNIMIPITTFAPQLSGKYKVYSVSLPQKDSRE